MASIFPDLAAAVSALRSDRLIAVSQDYFPGIVLSDDYIAECLTVAEAAVQDALRVYITPREVIPVTADPSEGAALAAAGNTVLLEPGYDYEPELFQPPSWGFIVLRQRPVSAVHSIQFVYPGPGNNIFTIPPDWVRLEPKYGQFNLVPMNSQLTMPVSAFMLQALGGGNRIPFMLQIRYRCGIENCATDYPEIVDLVKRWALYSLIEDRFLATSNSVSADGLSQSISWDGDKQRDKLEARGERIRQKLHGVRMGVM